ncbi:hypothetical protein K2173_026578 [Erythroxylum novogranatense]|uniref:Uncharacterized protein n=1 Tax=Erythroxylum novogranatense TaxID=1862640 RepID=A0AAV8TWM5_9ROSI|nr:hypothetical protein K2173_026578 [Erythroxylum novogranatense]
MVSKRQKLAKKRYREAHPELFPKPEPAPPGDTNKKKKMMKRKSKFKRQRTDSKDPSKSKFRKRPLRVPGMKPGDTCFICKAQDHIAKACPRKAEWEKNKICLLCRQRGHSLKHCPKKNDETINAKFCYNCGETGHSLWNCPYPLQDGGTKFASCFICNEQGHLSKDCPQNSRGVYPKGGCCKICGGVTHLAKDCPDKGKKSPLTAGNDRVIENGDRPKVTKFSSGDDLDDDFVIEATHGSSVDDQMKSKKKQGLKANSSSGMAVHDECKLKFLELKAKRNYRFIVFKIESQQVVVEKLGSPEETYDDFTASFPADDCRYAVYDFDFITDENCQKSKIFFVAWSPDAARVRCKMVYASSKDRFKRELDGIQVELQATDPSEMSMDIVKARAL